MSVAPAVDAVVLAQASMAVVLDRAQVAGLGVPVLSSPRSAVARAVEVLSSAAAPQP